MIHPSMHDVTFNTHMSPYRFSITPHLLIQTRREGHAFCREKPRSYSRAVHVTPNIGK
jgi:hypothetical protein